jgi:hypothetical protein
MAGLLFTGTVNGVQVAFIPVDIRGTLAKVLGG